MTVIRFGGNTIYMEKSRYVIRYVGGMVWWYGVMDVLLNAAGWYGIFQYIRYVKVEYHL